MGNARIRARARVDLDDLEEEDMPDACSFEDMTQSLAESLFAEFKIRTDPSQARAREQLGLHVRQTERDAFKQIISNLISNMMLGEAEERTEVLQ